MVRVQWDTGSHFLNQTPWGSEVGRNPTVTHTSGYPEHLVSLMSSPSMWYCGDSCPHTGTPESTERPTPQGPTWVLTHVLTHLHHAVFWGLGGWLGTCFPVLYLYLWLLSIFRWKENMKEKHMTMLPLCKCAQQGRPSFPPHLCVIYPRLPFVVHSGATQWDEEDLIQDRKSWVRWMKSPWTHQLGAFDEGSANYDLWSIFLFLV